MSEHGKARLVPRRPGVLGVHSLDQFGLAVPDLAEAARFFGDFGLDLRERPKGLQLQTAGSEHGWASLSEGPRKALQFLSFGAFADDLDRFRERLTRLGIERIDPPGAVESNGLWFRDCDGIPIEIKVAEKRSPDAPADFRHAPRAERAAAEFAVSQHRRARAPGAARSYARFSRATSGGASGSTAMCWASGCRTKCRAPSPSCMPSTAPTTMSSLSQNPTRRASTTAAGMSARSRTWGKARATWPSEATGRAGGSAAMCSARTSSSTSATPGAPTRNIPAAPTTSPPMPTGGPSRRRQEDAFYLWGPPPPEDFVFNYEAHPEAPRR